MAKEESTLQMQSVKHENDDVESGGDEEDDDDDNDDSSSKEDDNQEENNEDEYAAEEEDDDDDGGEEEEDEEDEEETTPNETRSATSPRNKFTESNKEAIGFLSGLPLEVITTVEPTNYAYPPLKNMSNGVLTHRNIFTEQEREVLRSIVDKYRDIVDTRSRTREIHLEKQNVWQQIVEEYNSTDNIMVRTEKELRKCWDNMKYRTRQAEKEKFRAEMNSVGLDTANVSICQSPKAFHIPNGVSNIKNIAKEKSENESASDNDQEADDDDDSESESEDEDGSSSHRVLNRKNDKEEEPVLKKARQESPKLSSILLSGHRNLSNRSTGLYNIPSCTKVVHIKKSKNVFSTDNVVLQLPLTKNVMPGVSVTNIPKPNSGTMHTPHNYSAYTNNASDSAGKLIPNFKNIASKNKVGNKTLNANKRLSEDTYKNQGSLLSDRLLQRRINAECQEHLLRMKVLQKELKAQTYQAQYWALRLKRLHVDKDKNSDMHLTMNGNLD